VNKKTELIKQRSFRFPLALVAVIGLVIGFGGAYVSMTKLGRFRATTVTPTLASGGESQKILATGGTISFKYQQSPITVQFPDHSVMGSTVEIKPIQQLDGLNAGSMFIQGVDITAQSHDLLSPATLTFTLPPEAKGKKLSAFAYRENGAEFHLFPLTITGDTATLQISHLSGYGIIAVNGFEDQPYKPTSVQDQTIQYIAAIINAAQSNMFTGQQDELSDIQKKQISNLMRVWYKNGVKAKLDAAQDDPAKILDAGLEYNAWRSWIQLLGVDEFLKSEELEGMQRLIDAIKKNVDQANKKCKENFDAEQAGVLIKLAALAEKFKSEDLVDFDSDYILKLAQQCAHFTLKITSTFTWNKDGSDGCGIFQEDFTGEIPITMGDDFTLSGEGELTLDKQLMCGNPCRVESGPDPMTTTLRVNETAFTVTGVKPTVSLELQMIDETQTRIRCPFIADGEDVGGAYEDAGWMTELYYKDVMSLTPKPKVMIVDWDIVNQGGVYARKDIDVDNTQLIALPGIPPTHEYTILELMHNPM
jgi:hypothetical protein